LVDWPNTPAAPVEVPWTPQFAVAVQGMLDYVDEGPESLDRVLADIDDAWPQP
jgi:hypothetical protein